MDGDTTLVARIGQDILDEAKVLVLVPRTVSGDNVNGPVSGVNQLADHCSSPKYAGPLAQGAVCLWTHYVHKTTLTVRDQFGDVLDDLYNGAEVTEHANQIPINQYVYSGEYTDPVGMIRYRRDPSDPNNDNPHTKYYIFQADSKEAKAWPTESLVPMANYDKTQSISVQVGGHELSPGIVGRRVITNPANNNISIQW